MNWKKSLVERLGNQCRVCNQSDVEKLDIDFLNDQEYLEDQYFENKDEMYVWFVLHFKDESKYLQSICVDCKSKKAEDESIPLSKLEEFHFTPKAMDRQEIMEWMSKKAEELLEFMRDNKQFIPIQRRMKSSFEKVFCVILYSPVLKSSGNKMLVNCDIYLFFNCCFLYLLNRCFKFFSKTFFY